MATTDTGDPVDDKDAAASVATRLGEATFVHLFTAADGDSIAAAGILGHLLTHEETPFQVSVVDSPAAAAQRIDGISADTTAVGVGIEIDGPTITGLPGSVDAYRVAAARDAVTERVGMLTLAGVLAAGSDLDLVSGIEDAARVAGARPRPGVAVPTSDLATGLAHTTLVHAPFSGRPTDAKDLLADIDVEGSAGGRAVASAVALTVCGEDGYPTREGSAIRPVLRPMLVDHPLCCVAGIADVLTAAAATAPGTAVGLALGRDVTDAALDVWREHGASVHAAVRDADCRRYAGVVAVDVAAPPRTTARLLRDFRSAEPAVLVQGSDIAALATTDRDAAEWLIEATDAASVTGRPRLATTTAVDDDLLETLTEVN